MNLQEKLNRIDQEIEAGLKLKSADRLRNLINEYPNELGIWEKLAELYYESGFIDAAGRYWILTEPKEERINESVAIYLNSVNNSGTKILQDITFRGDKDKLPEFAKNRLNELEQDSQQKSNYIPTFKPKRTKNKRRNSEYIETFKDKLAKAGIIGIGLLILFLLLMGFITVTSWFW